jgi:cell division protein FtsL
MKRSHNQSILRRFFSSKLFIVVFLLLAVLLVFGFVRSYYRDYKVKEEIKTLEEQIDSLSGQRLESMEILKYVMSDSYVEEKARTELNLKKEGEKVLIINDISNTEYKNINRGSSRQTIPNPLKWWYYFTKSK